MGKGQKRVGVVKHDVKGEGIIDAKTPPQGKRSRVTIGVEETPSVKVWEIELTETSAGILAGIKDQRVKALIAKRIDGLQHDPEKQGKQLYGELDAFRSLRAVGQRYRIIYRADDGRVVVVIASIGMRKAGDKTDVYALTKKLLKLGLLDE